MDVEKIFHMTGGVGKTSYARNSSLQKKASDLVKHITIMTIRELYLSNTPKSLGIADLGCSTGHNALSTIKDIVQAVEEISRKVLCPPPEFRVYLNDLPSNDFNTVFKALPEFYKELKGERSGECSSVYIAGYPGSFYGRVFPNNSLHFIYSSNCLHWLSKVPSGLYEEKVESINKGTIYISKASPPQVSEAYLKQFQEDFSLFLTLRSEELIEGGRMVLILLGREGQDHVDRGNSFFWELLTRSFNILVSQGDVEKEKLDSYDVHFYAPSKDEVMEEVMKEGSFEIDMLEMFELNKDEREGKSYGAAVAMTVRAIQESMICHHFGEEILDALFDNYARLIDEEVAKEDISPIGFVLVLRKPKI